MDARHLVMLLAVATLGLGLVMTATQLRAQQPVVPSVTVALAAVPIAPYTIISEDMVENGTVTKTEATRRSAYPLEATIGLMTIGAVPPGELLTADNAKPVEEVRYVRDLGLEIVSLQASVERVVGGKVRPGHLVNLYGTGQDEGGTPISLLIEPRIWVVGVSSSGQPVGDPRAQPDLETGELDYVGTEAGRPGTLLTVAVRPDQAAHIIYDVGARRLVPYVTLAASGSAQFAATPVASPAPLTVAPLPPTPWASPPPFPTLPDGGYGPSDR